MFHHNGRTIAVVTRCFTSGIRSSDLGVYAAGSDGRYHRVLYREPVWGSLFRSTQSGDAIRVSLQADGDTETSAFTFMISSCFDPVDERPGT